MGGSRVVRPEPSLPPVHIGWRLDTATALKAIHAGELFVLDDYPWMADFGILRGALDDRRHVFGKKFWGEPPAPIVSEQIDRLIDEATGCFQKLYPTLAYDSERPTWRGDVRKSWRPMKTGPEPMHFDSYPGPSLVTAYLNVSDQPRVYRLSYSFQDLLRLFPERMRYIWKKIGHLDDMAYELREREDSPLRGAPWQEVRLAPGSIWFFDAKTVSHQVIYGAGVIGLAWECHGALEIQASMMRRTFANWRAR